MDRKLSRNEEIRRLIALSEAARATLDDEVSTLKHRFDFPARIKSSLKQHPSGWLLGSLVSGFLGSALFRRRPATVAQKNKGLLLTLLGLALTAGRPFAKVWLTDQVKNHLLGRPGIFAAKGPRGRSEFHTPI